MKPKLPPSSEWDFTDISPEEMPDAIVWEYARTSKKISMVINQWLASEIDGKTIGQHLKDAVNVVLTNPSESFKRSNLLFEAIDPPRLRSKIVGSSMAFTKAVSDICELILIGRVDFSSHWSAVKMDFQEHRNPVAFVSPLKPRILGAIEAFQGNQDTQLTAEALGRGYHLKIKWGEECTVQKIIQDFTVWVTKEAEIHGGVKGPGRASEPLKWLAAYRLSQAGFTFCEAQAKLLAHSKKIKYAWNEKRSILPIYAEKSGWSDAVLKAKKHLTKFELGL